MIRNMLLLLLCLPILSATYCSNPSSTVCTSEGITYSNESVAVSAGSHVIHCGPCSGLATQYYACSANYTQYGNYSNQSGSILERYLACGFRSALGGSAATADIFMAMIIIGFFLAFVMMQNTRFDAKIAIMIPVIIMAGIWVTTGWLVTMLIFGIGILLYLALGKIINK